MPAPHVSSMCLHPRVSTCVSAVWSRHVRAGYARAARLSHHRQATCVRSYLCLLTVESADDVSACRGCGTTRGIPVACAPPAKSPTGIRSQRAATGGARARPPLPSPPGVVLGVRDVAKREVAQPRTNARAPHHPRHTQRRAVSLPRRRATTSRLAAAATGNLGAAWAACAAWYRMCNVAPRGTAWHRVRRVRRVPACAACATCAACAALVIVSDGVHHAFGGPLYSQTECTMHSVVHLVPSHLETNCSGIANSLNSSPCPANAWNSAVSTVGGECVDFRSEHRGRRMRGFPQ